MADEIQVGLDLLVENGNLKSSKRVPKSSLKVDQTTAALIENVQNIGTSHEALDMGGITTAGYAYFRNLDATNFVEIGIDVSATFHATVKLKAGEACVFRLTTNAPYAQADSAACDLQYMILDD